jgi:hypothetical protein
MVDTLGVFRSKGWAIDFSLSGRTSETYPQTAQRGWAFVDCLTDPTAYQKLDLSRFSSEHT